MAELTLNKSATDDGDYEQLLNHIDEQMENIEPGTEKEITLTIKLINDYVEDEENDEEEEEETE